MLSQRLCLIVVSRFNDVEQWPKEQEESLNGALGLSDRGWKLQDLSLLIDQEFEQKGSGLGL